MNMACQLLSFFSSALFSSTLLRSAKPLSPERPSASLNRKHPELLEKPDLYILEAAEGQQVYMLFSS